LFVFKLQFISDSVLECFGCWLVGWMDGYVYGFAYKRSLAGIGFKHSHFHAVSCGHSLSFSCTIIKVS